MSGDPVYDQHAIPESKNLGVSESVGGNEPMADEELIAAWRAGELRVVGCPVCSGEPCEHEGKSGE